MDNLFTPISNPPSPISLQTQPYSVDARTFTRRTALRDSVVIDSSDALQIRTIDSANITLTVEPYVTEAAMQITINDRNPMRAYSVLRNGETISAGTLVGTDTVLYDTTLTPSTNYTYKVYRLDGGTAIDSSTTVSVTTLTPTTHNWG